MIADGIHVEPAVVALACQLAGPARFSVVTDAIAALRMAPGEYRLGTMDVTVDATSARLADGRLAGSILSPGVAVRNAVRFTGCSPAAAIGTVTRVPARLLGLDADRGTLAPGAVADLVVLTDELEVVSTIVRGELVHDRPRSYR